MSYDFVDASHPDARNLRCTSIKGEIYINVLWVHVSKCQLEADGKIYTMEFNLVDARNNQIVAKARLYGAHCECGAYKASKIAKGAYGHSPWCGWYHKNY